MPVKTFGIVFGLLGLLLVAICLLLRRNPHEAARNGSRLKRRLIGTGLAVFAMLGLGTLPGCEKVSRERPKARTTPAAKTRDQPKAENALNLNGTRFGPKELDTNNQPVETYYKATPLMVTTVESIFESLQQPKKRSKRERTTCYIIRLRPKQPSLVTPARVLKRMCLIQKFMETNTLSKQTIERMLAGVDIVIDTLDHADDTRNDAGRQDVIRRSSRTFPQNP